MPPGRSGAEKQRNGGGGRRRPGGGRTTRRARGNGRRARRRLLSRLLLGFRSLFLAFLVAVSGHGRRAVAIGVALERGSVRSRVLSRGRRSGGAGRGAETCRDGVAARLSPRRARRRAEGARGVPSRRGGALRTPCGHRHARHPPGRARGGSGRLQAERRGNGRRRFLADPSEERVFEGFVARGVSSLFFVRRSDDRRRVGRERVRRPRRERNSSRGVRKPSRRRRNQRSRRGRKQRSRGGRKQQRSRGGRFAEARSGVGRGPTGSRERRRRGRKPRGGARGGCFGPEPDPGGPRAGRERRRLAERGGGRVNETVLRRRDETREEGFFFF